MSTFNWVAAFIVIVSLIYISFILTVADWLVALRKGQAVTLLPERKGGKWPLWTQIAVLVIGLVICVPFFYYLWIPLFALPTNIASVFDIIGLVVYLAGFAFVLWARRALGRNWGLTDFCNEVIETFTKK